MVVIREYYNIYNTHDELLVLPRALLIKATC